MSIVLAVHSNRLAKLLTRNNEGENANRYAELGDRDRIRSSLP